MPPTAINASKWWINYTLKSRYVRVMLLVVVKGKTIFSLYVMVIFLLIEIILYFQEKMHEIQEQSTQKVGTLV